MVGHEHKGQYLCTKPVAGLSQRVQKYPPVLVVVKKRPSLVSSRKDMVIGIFILNSPGYRHSFFPIML